MSPPRFRQAVLQSLMDEYGQTWSADAGFTVTNTPSRLFRLLCLSLLLSARITSELSVRGARALSAEGWTTPAKMLESTWARRARVLNRSGYARFDERTASMLGDVSALVVDRWKGDLRNLRAEAGRRRDAERKLLKECKGIGDVGADIFFREVQGVWPEISPFLDARALDAARRLGLGSDVATVARRVPAEQLPALAAALVRVDLDDGYSRILHQRVS